MGDLERFNLIVIKRKHIKNHGSDETFVSDVESWTKKGTAFMIVPDDWKVHVNKQGDE